MSNDETVRMAVVRAIEKYKESPKPIYCSHEKNIAATWNY